MPLPRPAYSIGLIAVKWKRKAEYRSHVLFESVRPNVVSGFLMFLKQHNHYIVISKLTWIIYQKV